MLPAQMGFMNRQLGSGEAMGYQERTSSMRHYSTDDWKDTLE